VWAKVDMIEKHIRDFDWIVWMDSDVLIMNFGIKLETFLDTKSEVVIAKDNRGLNAGIFFLRNSENIDRLLRVWKSQASKDIDEQEVLASLLQSENFSEIVKYMPQCAFNSYIITTKFMARYEYGDFAVHFAGSNWVLVDDMRVWYNFNVIDFWTELIGDDGMTLWKWLSLQNILKILSIPWDP